MREGWEIKKLGEICDIIGGSTPKRTEKSFWENGIYPWFTIEDIRTQGRIITDTQQKITLLAWNKLRVVPKNSILLCCTASIGEYALTKIPLTTNQQFNALVIKDETTILPEFLMLVCSTFKDILLSMSGKATINFVSADKVKQILIPIPPLSEQQKIVEELDCLSKMIELKKKQLETYDKLAQSIFYDMFGNPITNEKGWKIKPLSQVCRNYDNLRKPITAKDREVGTIPYYGASGIVDFVKDYIFDGDYLLVSEDGANLLVRHTPIAFSATGKIWVNNHAHILGFDKIETKTFVEYFINLMDISHLITGCAQPKLTQANLNTIPVFDIPERFQQQFAEKIEAIEKQKELIKQTLKGLEELFNSRMDYYFN